jgi:hypothetical protein
VSAPWHRVRPDYLSAMAVDLEKISAEDLQKRADELRRFL